jgi:hypothetical protein
VFPAPDDPITIDESAALSPVILGPGSPHSGKGVVGALAIQAASECLTRCRAALRRYRNTLVFVAPDESQLTNARDSTRQSLA